MAQALPSRQSKKWTQSNATDTEGVVVRSKNMDFDIETYIRLAKRARAVFTTDDDADFVRPTSFSFFDTSSEYIITTPTNIFKMTLNEDVTVIDDSATSGAPTMDSNGYSDSVNWQGYVYISGVLELRRYNGTYSAKLADLSSGGPLCVHEQKNYLAVGQGNTVRLYDTSHTLVVTLTLNSDLYVTSIDYSSGNLYIATRHIQGGEAQLIEWDGNTAVGNNSWGVGATRINSVKRYESTVALITSTGRLLKFTGGGFTELDTFPIYHTDIDWDRPGRDNTGRVIHRGMVVEDELIFINISPRILLSGIAQNEALLYNWFLGGIHCYDPKVGIYHRSGFSSSERSRTAAVTTTNVNTTTDIITIAAGGVPVSGTPVMYDAQNNPLIGGLADGMKYYVIKISGTTMKLASTMALATAASPTAIDLTSTGNNSQHFNFWPNRDFGATGIVGGNAGLIDASCAIAILKQGSSNVVRASTGRRLLFGGKMGTNLVAEKYVLCVAAAEQENRGYFITSKIPATFIKDKIQTFTVKYRGVDTAEDMIIPKYRTIERADCLDEMPQSLIQTGIWSSLPNSFNTAADMSNVAMGDEIEIVNGSGAGYLAHVTDTVFNATTSMWGVFIDESIQNCAKDDTFYFFTENWVKCEEGPITSDDNDIYTNEDEDDDLADGGDKSFSVSGECKWIQFKIELRGEDVEIEELFINNVSIRQFV